MGSNNGNTLEVNLDKYAVLFKDLFFSLLQIVVTVFLLIAIINITKQPADALYPIDLNHPYYTDDKCDLTDIKAGETEFCEEFKKPKVPSVETPFTTEEAKNLHPGKSYFSKIFRSYAENMGYVTADTNSMFILWITYLLYSCDHFLMIWLHGAHSVAQSLNSIDKRLSGIVLIIIASMITHWSLLYVNPLITRLLFPNMVRNHPNSFFIKAGSQIFISFLCIVILILLFFIVPCTIYYVIALCILFLKNLSIQINVLTIFSIYLCIKALILFIEFMTSQFGANSIANQLNDAEERKLNRQQDRIEDRNNASGKSGCPEKHVYSKGGRGSECVPCPTNSNGGASTIVSISDGICGILHDTEGINKKTCNKSARKGGGGFWINDYCVVSPEDNEEDVQPTPKEFKRVVMGKNKVVYWESI